MKTCDGRMNHVPLCLLPFFSAINGNFNIIMLKSQYWLHKTGASHEHWQIKISTITYEDFNENIK